MTLETERPHIVWIQGHRGPEAQLWASFDYGVNDWRKKESNPNAILAAYPITEEEMKLPIDVVKRLYPNPQTENA